MPKWMPATCKKHGTAALNADPYCQNKSALADAQTKTAWSSAAISSVNVEDGSTLGVSV
ncbi:hypothetical protein DPMN_166795 [Dreissena polymorpha]|uniref:Uncharacterized protein n=1 Tax=Dreissena polymorpha TaxID=45954 RepID=A0A9D4EZ98_DREPO|nr:hypothetical protein DPMN_166795 [Dreissena polymorpha]